MILLEAFTVLLRDPNHWLFEFLVGGIEEIVTGVIIGAVIWPKVMRHWHRDAPHKNEPHHCSKACWQYDPNYHP